MVRTRAPSAFSVPTHHGSYFRFSFQCRVGNSKYYKSSMLIKRLGNVDENIFQHFRNLTLNFSRTVVSPEGHEKSIQLNMCIRQ